MSFVFSVYKFCTNDTSRVDRDSSVESSIIPSGDFSFTKFYLVLLSFLRFKFI